MAAWSATALPRSRAHNDRSPDRSLGRGAALLVAAALLLAGCTSQAPGGGGSSVKATRSEAGSASASAEGSGSPASGSADIHPGDGAFRYDGPGSPADHPQRVFYHAPSGDLATAQILIVLHGAQRDPEGYRDDWKSLVGDQNVLVILPEFNEHDYPGSSGYNVGNLVDDHGDPLPASRWSFSVVEPLFDYVVRSIGSSAKDYALFGHSAGAQYVTRFTEFMPNVRARVVVAANAGWYTVPDDGVDFPYGFDKSPADPASDLYERPLILLLGADDVDPNDDSLQRDKNTDKQGKNRLNRGLNFFQSAREAAGDKHQFTWSMVVVPGIAHSHGDMARAALPYLFPDLFRVGS
jgi:poly(3-hydroxybutyrate) depolymerase